MYILYIHFKIYLITLILNYTPTKVNKPYCSNPGTKWIINRLHINLHTQTKDGSSFTTGCKKASVRQIGYICSVKLSNGVQEQLISIKLCQKLLNTTQFYIVLSDQNILHSDLPKKNTYIMS